MKRQQVFNFSLVNQTIQSEIVGDIFNLSETSLKTNPALLHGEYWAYHHDQNPELVRDKMGVAPCYYFIFQNHLFISSNFEKIFSEAKTKGLQLSFHHQYAHELEKYDFSRQDATLIKEIKRCPAGTKISFMKNGGEWTEITTKYWNPLDQNFVKDIPLIELVQKCIADRIQAQKKVGLFLSGGLDSSILYQGLNSYSTDQWKAFSLDFSISNKAHEKNLRFLTKNIVKIPWSEEAAIQCLYQNPHWPKTTLYSPSLGLFLPMYELAKKFEASTIWTGLGGDDIFTYPEIAYSHNSITKILFYLKSIYKKNQGSLLQRSLRNRIEWTGRYSFGMEYEQQVAMSYNLKMSYPLMDDRLYSWMLHHHRPDKGPYNLGKPALREAWRNLLPDSIVNERSAQDLIDVQQDLLQKSYQIEREKDFSFFKGSVILKEHFERIKGLLDEKNS